MGRLRSLGCCPENTAIDKGAEWNEKNTSGLDAAPANAEGHKDLLLLLSGHVMVVSQLLSLSPSNAGHARLSSSGAATCIRHKSPHASASKMHAAWS